MSTMLNALVESRAAKAAEAAALLDGEASAEALETVEARHAEIATLDEQIKTVQATQTRAAEIASSRAESRVGSVGRAVVTNEPLTYSETGERSFVRDMINAQIRNDRGAWDNLHRHMQEVTTESRSINRTDGTGGEFVPPLWLVDQYAKTLRAGRVTADRLTQMALPAGTDSVSIPRITTGTDTSLQTSDNAATTTQDLATTSVTAPVRTVSGYEDISIQLVEQSPLAGGLDRMIFTDLLASYNYRLNAAVINGVGTAGDLTGMLNTVGIGTVTYTAGTPTAQGIITAIAQGLSTVAKNRYMGAEAITMHPSIWYMLVGAVDGSNRPLVVPSVSGPTNASGVIDVAGGAEGLVGTVHGVPVYLDAAIPVTLSSTQSAIIVSKFSDTFLMESGAKTRVLPDVGSSTLSVRFQLYGYVAIAARYPAGIAKIVGTGLVPQTGY